MGRLKIALKLASKGQKSYKNYMEDPMGETYNLIILKSNKSKSYNNIFFV
jgi:hypothetical protein